MRAFGSSLCTEVGLRRLGAHNFSSYLQFAPVIISATFLIIFVHSRWFIRDRKGFYYTEGMNNFLFDYWLEIN